MSETITSTSNLLTHAELRVANRLQLASRRTFTGSVKGERTTRRKGTSIEFADYRNYVEGDDLRHLDWNVLARLDTPVMRTYLDEQDLAVYVILDCSRSMDFGSPTKFEFGRKLALILGLAALNSGDALYALDPSSIGITRAIRGRAWAGKWMRLPETWRPEGTRPIGNVVRTFSTSGHRRGIVILISDGLDPSLPQALTILGSSGFEILFAHVLSQMDLDPDIEGDLRLVDSESEDNVDLTANRFALQSYKNSLARHADQLEKATRRVGGRYLALRSHESIDVDTVRKLEKDGWVRR
jgi:uncharacterized protein (DUF58 family)